jgi:hypothetical protein
MGIYLDTASHRDELETLVDWLGQAKQVEIVRRFDVVWQTAAAVQGLKESLLLIDWSTRSRNGHGGSGQCREEDRGQDHCVREISSPKGAVGDSERKREAIG